MSRAQMAGNRVRATAGAVLLREALWRVTQSGLGQPPRAEFEFLGSWFDDGPSSGGQSLPAEVARTLTARPSGRTEVGPLARKD